jgi:hypothetical protein
MNPFGSMLFAAIGHLLLPLVRLEGGGGPHGAHCQVVGEQHLFAKSEHSGKGTRGLERSAYELKGRSLAGRR